MTVHLVPYEAKRLPCGSSLPENDSRPRWLSDQPHQVRQLLFRRPLVYSIAAFGRNRPQRPEVVAVARVRSIFLSICSPRNAEKGSRFDAMAY